MRRSPPPLRGALKLVSVELSALGLSFGDAKGLRTQSSLGVWGVGLVGEF